MRNGSTCRKHFVLNSLEANKIANFEHRCNEFLETYGGTSEKFEKLLEMYYIVRMFILIYLHIYISYLHISKITKDGICYDIHETLN